jgi:tetratricopeptide (TPR) repeat protein
VAHGDDDDLEDAIAALEEAVASLRACGEPPAGATSLWAAALRSRALLSGDVADLDRAAGALRDALTADPDAPGRWDLLNTLGVVLSDRYELTHHLVDLRASLEAQRTAVEHRPADHVLAAHHLNNLGVSLMMLFEVSGDLGTLTEALGVLQQAVDRSSTGGRTSWHVTWTTWPRRWTGTPT